MFQKFGTDTLKSKFVKCLLWDTYVPIVGIWKPGRALIEGFNYITYDKYIVKAEKDFDGNSDGPQSAFNSEYFKIIEPYIEGQFYRGITSNLESNSFIYDSDTHYYLGQYLRLIRDLHDLDLMPFYNCWDGTTSDRIRIVDDISSGDKFIQDNTLVDGYTTYIVPIKFNQTYTIYFNSNIPFKVRPGYYDRLHLWDVLSGNNSTSVKSTTYRRCSFNNPVTFSLLEHGNGIIQGSTSRFQEDYLVLVLQLPTSLNSNLVVLEGDYKNIKLNNLSETNKLSPKYISISNPDPNSMNKIITEQMLNDIMKPVSSLTTVLTNKAYAFNDRLLEYLLYAPIIDKDRIKNNILNIQRYVSSNKIKNIISKESNGDKFSDVLWKSDKKDIWDPTLRYYIYNLVTNYCKSPVYLDINGFVDKDSEFIIDKGRE